MNTLASLVFFFARFSIGVLFAYSSFGKLRDFKSFSNSVRNFHILPSDTSDLFARAFVLGEIFVVLCMVIGGDLLAIGFMLSLFLLSLFTVAILVILSRKAQVSCNCFGTSNKPLSRYEVLRNFAFIMCSLVGLIFKDLAVGSEMDFIFLLVTAFCSIVFVVISTSIPDLLEVIVGK